MRLIAGAFTALAMVSTCASAAQRDWVKVEDKALGYSAEFPAAPQPGVTVEQGVTIKSKSAGVPGILCMVLTGDYGQNVDVPAELAASRDNFVKGVGATLNSQKQITVQRGSASLPALEFDSSNANVRFRSILIVDGHLVYQVTGGVPNKGGDDSNLEHCMHGITLLPH